MSDFLLTPARSAPSRGAAAAARPEALPPGPPMRRVLWQAMRGLIGPVLLFSAVANLLILASPIFMLQVYDRVLASRSEATLIALFGLTGFLLAAMSLLDHARGRLMARIAARLLQQLEAPIFRAGLRREALAPGDPLARTAVPDLDLLYRWLASPGPQALLDAPWTPLFLALIFLFHPMLGLLALSGGVVLAMLALLGQLAQRRHGMMLGDRGLRAARLAEALRQEAGLAAALGLGPGGLKRWQDLRSGLAGVSLATADLASLLGAVGKALRLLLQAAMLALGAWLVLKDQLGPGAMIVGSIMAGRALAPVEAAIGQWSAIEAARGAWARLGIVMISTPPEAAPLPLPRPSAALTLSGVSVLPPGGQRIVLQGLRFNLDPGSALGVIGPSGAGKSSLARLLVGVWPPAAGSLRLGGQSLPGLDPQIRAALTGYLPQHVGFFETSIAGNIARLDPDAEPQAIHAAARAAGAHRAILALPLGYETPLSGNASGLPGGLLQRICLARALYGEPLLLVLDEPDAHLDPEGSRALAGAIRGHKARGGCLVIMAHRAETLGQCEKILWLEAGQIRQIGPREEVLRAQMRQRAEAPIARSSVSGGARHP